MTPLVVILGLGKSGQAVQAYCQEHQIPTLCLDDDPSKAPLTGREDLSSHAIPKGAWAVVSPGVAPDHPAIQWFHARTMDVLSEVEFALRIPKDSQPHLIGVTGTNGKTTVVSLTAHMFTCAGIPCQAAGNIGLPLIEAVTRHKAPWCVVELSSFQLENTFSPLFERGCWTSFAPNHLDRHVSMEAYRKAKQRLAQLVTAQGELLLHESIPPLDIPVPAPTVVRYGIHSGTMTTQGKTILLQGQAVGTLPEALHEAPAHDVENFLAAFWMAYRSNISPEILSASYSTFTKPRHRIEYITTLNGVTYWDDSKGTNIAATVAAVNAVPGPVVLIAGGVHKGAPYTAWKKAFAGKVHSVIAIGQAKDRIATDLSPEIPVLKANSLQEAVTLAEQESRSPGSVLLSPGCSSYDMFSDYQDRGGQFQRLVLERKARQ